jgi:hypothetical protein
MTKAEWIEEVRIKAMSRASISSDTINKGDEYRFHPVFVEKILNNIYNEIVHTYYNQGKVVNNSMFTKRYSQTFSTDIDTGIKYLAYPEKFVAISDSQGAVRFIKAKSTYGITFEPIKDSDLHYFIGSEIALIDEVVGYVSNQERVDLFGEIDSAILTSGVFMDVVIPFEAYESTDEIHIPVGQDEAMFERAISVLMDDKVQIDG